MIIEYYSADDLSRIMDMLDNIDLERNSEKPKLEY